MRTVGYVLMLAGVLAAGFAGYNVYFAHGGIPNVYIAVGGAVLAVVGMVLKAVADRAAVDGK
jgi:hypothetical protein